MSTTKEHWDLDLHDVAKTYRGGVEALCGISMQVRRGEIFGLLGPNGAGKSTLVKILMTIIRPTRCRGTMLGKPVGSRAVLRNVGFLPEHLQFPDYLTGLQALDYYAALAKVPRKERRVRADELLQLVGMNDWRKSKIRIYSKGMRQRLGLAQALMNNPQLMLFDEPTDGLDPVGRRNVRDLLIRMKDQGKTVFINSHILSELEMVCDRVAILSNGKLITQGTIEELTQHSRRYEIELSSPLPDDEDLNELIRLLKAKTKSENRKTSIVVPTDQTAEIQPLIDSLRKSGGMIESINPVRQSLEDLFIQAVNDSTGKNPDRDSNDIEIRKN